MLWKGGTFWTAADPRSRRVGGMGTARGFIPADEDWKEYIGRLINAEAGILCLVGKSASLQWEMEQILNSRDALDRTLFIRPPGVSEQAFYEALGTPPHGCVTDGTFREQAIAAAHRDRKGWTVITSQGLEDVDYEACMDECLQLYSYIER
jgi:hypothetical protein